MSRHVPISKSYLRRDWHYRNFTTDADEGKQRGQVCSKTPASRAAWHWENLLGLVLRALPSRTSV